MNALLEALLLGSVAFLFAMWFFGYIVGTGLSRTLEQRSPEAVPASRLRVIRGSYPARRMTTGRHATYPGSHETALQRAA